MKTIIDYLIDNALALIAILISLLAYIHSRKSDKADIKRKIAKKKAELQTISSIHNFTDPTTANNNSIRQSVLSKEIEELEKLL